LGSQLKAPVGLGLHAAPRQDAWPECAGTFAGGKERGSEVRGATPRGTVNAAGTLTGPHGEMTGAGKRGSRGAGLRRVGQAQDTAQQQRIERQACRVAAGHAAPCPCTVRTQACRSKWSLPSSIDTPGCGVSVSTRASRAMASTGSLVYCRWTSPSSLCKAALAPQPVGSTASTASRNARVCTVVPGGRAIL